MARDDYKKRRRLFDDEERGGFAFREVFTPDREGPLPRPPAPHRSGKGGPSLGASNAPPVISSSPVVTGTAAVGQTLSCDNGTWFNAPTSYTYQWLRDGANIASATVSTYGVVAGDLGHMISCKVTATNANGSTPATSNAVLIVAIPVNTVAPVISGSLTVGSTLSCSQGTWTNSPTSYAYQWLQNGVNISGATASSYVVLTGDAGTSIRCTVTASNATASGTATSNALAIAALPSAPSNTVAPVVSGTATVGSTLSCSQGIWTNSPTGYAYQWQRNGVDTSGATGATYLTVTADGGTSVSCRVAATNAGGTTSQASNTLAIAAGATGSVWSASDAATNSMTLTNGGLTVTAPAVDVWGSVRSTIGKTSGKLYVEFLGTGTFAGGNTPAISGAASSSFNPSDYLSTTPYSFGLFAAYGATFVSSGFTENYNLPAGAITVNDVWAVAIDFTAGKVWFARNNVWENGSNPATGSLPIVSFTPATVGALFAGMSLKTGGGSWTLHPTDASLAYRPPVGFQAWDGGPVTPSASVWSAADAAANGFTLTNGGLTVTPSGAGSWQSVRGSISKSSGMVYVEFANSVTAASTLPGAGTANAGFTPTTYLGGAASSFGGYCNGTEYGTNFTAIHPLAASVTPQAGDVVGMAIDFGAGNVWFAYNNVWVASGNPATGANPSATFTPATVGALFPAMAFNGPGNGVWALQSQPAQQKYLPPVGFQAWDGGPVTPSTSVWSASDAAAGSMTLTNGGLTVAPTLSGVWRAIRATTSKTSGKFYIEFSNSVSAANWQFSVGLGSAGMSLSGGGYALGGSNYSVGIITATAVNVSAGFTKNYSVSTPNWTPPAGTVFALAVDFDAGNIWFADNNTWANSSNPATGSLPAVSFVPATVGALFAAMDFEMTGVGVWTLQSTAASQKYAPPSGFSAWDGGAPAHSAQALAYLARTVGGNEGGNGTNVANLIDGLVSDGVWAKLDALYVLAQQNATDANLNLVSTSYTLPVTTATFTAYKGYSAFPAAGGIDTGFNPSSSPSPNYVLTSASAGVWVYEQDTNGGIQIASDLNGYLEIVSNFNMGGVFACDVNTTAVTIPTPGATGLFCGDTAAATIVHPYWNGADKGAQTGAGSNIPANNVRIGGATTSGWYNAKNLSAAFIGASLGSAGQLALYNRLRTYMTAIGVP